MVNNKKIRKKKKEKKNEQTIALPPTTGASLVIAIANLTLAADRPNDKKDSNDDGGETSVCLHGISADKMSDSEYLGTLGDWLTCYKQMNETDADAKQTAYITNEFFIKRILTLLDPEFARFVFGVATQSYLDKGLKDERTICLIRQLLILGIHIRYSVVPIFFEIDVGHGSKMGEKFIKYSRDLTTNRGIIKCLARETQCSCMNEAKKRAALMDKNGFCNGCRKEFPQKEMFYCICKYHIYCSKDCQLKAWPKHKSYCMKTAENVYPFEK